MLNRVGGGGEGGRGGGKWGVWRESVGAGEGVGCMAKSCMFYCQHVLALGCVGSDTVF